MANTMMRMMLRRNTVRGSLVAIIRPPLLSYLSEKHALTLDRGFIEVGAFTR
jgi:hypothetical protein